jgi:hypothetical protein
MAAIITSNKSQETNVSCSQFIFKKGKQITSQLIVYFAIRVNQAASISSMSAFSVSVFFTYVSNKTVNMCLFYEWSEYGNVWDDDLENNTQNFVLVCVSIL